MYDALVSPAVAAGAALVSIASLIVASRRVNRSTQENIVPLMGVVGAFIFAAQMINFSIPGTGSSGHIVAGVLSGALLGPWAALITIASVLVVQCLVFADGGLMALGCNILNMGICTTLIGYGLVYRPFVSNTLTGWRIFAGSILGCVIGLECGALLVTIETELSGITALDWNSFFALMCSIHFAIGVSEGIATGFLLYFVAKSRPQLLTREEPKSPKSKSAGIRNVVIFFAALTVVLGGAFSWIASSSPDGLEWSIEKLTGSTELTNSASVPTRHTFEAVQSATTVLPDYESTWSGIIGCVLVVILTWVLAVCIRKGLKRRPETTHPQ